MNEKIALLRKIAKGRDQEQTIEMKVKIEYMHKERSMGIQQPLD